MLVRKIVRMPILKDIFYVSLTCTICNFHMVAVFTKYLLNQRTFMQGKHISVNLPHGKNWSSDSKVKHTLINTIFNWLNCRAHLVFTDKTLQWKNYMVRIWPHHVNPKRIIQFGRWNPGPCMFISNRTLW